MNKHDTLLPIWIWNIKPMWHVFVSLGVVQSALCEQVEVSELVKSLEQSGERPQCPCSPLRATRCNSSSLLMVQNSLALQTLRCSLQPYTPENKKGELYCVALLLPEVFFRFILRWSEWYIKVQKYTWNQDLLSCLFWLLNVTKHW